jgi:hypothetical protein
MLKAVCDVCGAERPAIWYSLEGCVNAYACPDDWPFGFCSGKCFDESVRIKQTELLKNKDAV